MKSQYLILDNQEIIYGPFDDSEIIDFLSKRNDLENLEICASSDSWKSLYDLRDSTKISSNLKSQIKRILSKTSIHQSLLLTTLPESLNRKNDYFLKEIMMIVLCIALITFLYLVI